MGYIIAAILAYLVGSVNSAIVVGRVWKQVDIRELGSGNAGATNTLRSLGVGPAVLVVLGDVLKGVIAVLLGRLLSGDETGAMVGGFFAVIGHNWPLYFRFKGGKGILTSAVVIIMIAPLIGSIVVVAAVLVIALTRYVSLGSLTGAVLLPVMIMSMENNNIPLLVFSIVLALLAIYRHRGNIKRLREGTERKLGSKK